MNEKEMNDIIDLILATEDISDEEREIIERQRRYMVIKKRITIDNYTTAAGPQLSCWKGRISKINHNNYFLTNFAKTY